MADSVVERVQEGAADSTGGGGRGDSGVGRFFRRLVTEKPLGTVGAVITLLLLLTGIFSDVLAPYGFNETEVGDFLQPPSAAILAGHGQPGPGRAEPGHLRRADFDGGGTRGDHGQHADLDRNRPAVRLLGRQVRPGGAAFRRRLDVPAPTCPS